MRHESSKRIKSADRRPSALRPVSSLIRVSIAGLLAQVSLSACSPTKFDQIPQSSSLALSEPAIVTPTPAQSKLSDLLLHTDMNIPIDFNAQVTAGDKVGSSRMIAVQSDNVIKWIKTKNGRLEVLDPKTMQLRYTPGPNFRGEDIGVIFLIEDGGRFVTSAVVRIQVDNPLITLKPALAVRATGCVMCHANIASNVITDFGYGNNYFFGGSTQGATDHTSIYADESTDPAWKYLDRLGDQVIVPAASTASLAKVGAPTLAAYLSNVLGTSSIPAVRNAKVTEVSSVYIGAPDAARIMNAGGLVTGVNNIKYIPDFDQPTAMPVIAHKIDATVDYFTNEGTTPIVCSGDLVIDGVVFLNKPVIETQTGCRIYTTKSVFVNGPITYSGGDPSKRNLQIVSARSINLGLGNNTCGAATIGTSSLNHRLKEEDRRQYFFTRGEAGKTVQQKLDDILADSVKVGNGNLIDAACDGTSARNVSFERLILNAPIVFSRYTGGFKGSIIAEIALMSLNKFVFEFDPVFASQVVLPLLSPNDYLQVK